MTVEPTRTKARYAKAMVIAVRNSMKAHPWKDKDGNKWINKVRMKYKLYMSTCQSNELFIGLD